MAYGAIPESFSAFSAEARSPVAYGKAPAGLAGISEKQ
jgi:hypothetical protein